MSNLGNTLRMLVLLKSRGKMSIKELSEILEVGKRQIIRYKDALEYAGLSIKTLPGKYGGYVYDDKEYLSLLNLTEEEFFALAAAQQQLINEEFINIKELNKLIEKISALRKENNIKLSDYYIKNKNINSQLDKEKKIWLDINSAIITNRKIKMVYASLKGEEERIVRPYAIFQYDGALYLVGYCELRQATRDFKLSRIKNYEIVDEKFKQDIEFRIQNYMKKSFGIHKEEEMNIKLKIKYPMSQIIKEKIWIENQKITEGEDHSIIFQANTVGKTEIKSWILSMGSAAEILEPENLRKEILEEVQKVIKIYK